MHRHDILIIKYHEYYLTKGYFHTCLTPFCNVLKLISWHFKYCENIFQKMFVLLLKYRVLTPKNGIYYDTPPAWTMKYLHFLFDPSSSKKRILKLLYLHEPLFRKALRAGARAGRIRRLRLTTRTFATRHRSRGWPGQPASCAVSSEKRL